MARIWHFFFHFYPILDYYKIRTRTNFENPNCKSLDLHLIMRFTLKKLFPGSTDFTGVIFKIPQYQNIFRLCSLIAPFSRMILGACFGLAPFAVDTAIETTIRGSFWNLTFLEEGSRDLGETSQGRFFGQNRYVSLRLPQL